MKNKIKILTHRDRTFEIKIKFNAYLERSPNGRHEHHVEITELDTGDGMEPSLKKDGYVKTYILNAKEDDLLSELQKIEFDITSMVEKVEQEAVDEEKLTTLGYEDAE